MTFLLFKIGADRYALEAMRIIEVLPILDLKAIPGTDRALVGVLNYHGEPVPVVDLSLMATGRPAARMVSTRLVVLRFAVGGEEKRLGVLVESATETIRLPEDDFVDSGISGAPFLGRIYSKGGAERGIIQWIEIEQLLSQEVRRKLWQPGALALE